MVKGLVPVSAVLTAPVRLAVNHWTSTGSTPRNVEELSPRWLEQALGLSTSAISEVKIRDVEHGTSLRVRLDITQAGKTTPLFIKQTPQRIPARLFNTAMRLCEHEVDFYRYWAHQSGCAPDALAACWHSATGRSTLVLPDLSDEGFQFHTVAEACSPDEAAQALEAMANLHRTFWNARLIGGSSGYQSHDSAAPLLTPLLCAYLGGTPGALADMVDRSFADKAHMLRRRARDIYPITQRFDRTLLHNDTHVGNIGFHSERALFVDWQACCIGSALKDVAYFMSLSLEPDMRGRHERALLTHYLDVLSAAGGPGIRFDDAWLAYRVLAISAYVAAATTFLSGDRLQDQANCAAGVRRSSTALVELDSFPALQDMCTQ